MAKETKRKRKAKSATQESVAKRDAAKKVASKQKRLASNAALNKVTAKRAAAVRRSGAFTPMEPLDRKRLQELNRAILDAHDVIGK